MSPPVLGYSVCFVLLLWDEGINIVLTFSSPDPSSPVKQLDLTSPCTIVFGNTEHHNLNIAYVVFVSIIILRPESVFSDLLVICAMSHALPLPFPGERIMAMIANCHCL